LQLKRGELIRVDEVKALWGRLIVACRNMMLQLPSRIAFGVPMLTKTDIASIDRLIRADLEDMALGRGYALGIDVADDAGESDGRRHPVPSMEDDEGKK
jgi:hypothetical protein